LGPLTMGNIINIFKLGREYVSVLAKNHRDILNLSISLAFIVVVRTAFELTPKPDSPVATINKEAAADLTPPIIFGGAKSKALHSCGNNPELLLLLKYESSVRLQCNPLKKQRRHRLCRVVIYRDPSERLRIEDTASEIRISVDRAGHRREIVIPSLRATEWVALLDNVETPPNYPGKIDGTVYWISPSPWFPPAPMAEEDQIPLEAWARFVLMKATAH